MRRSPLKYLLMIVLIVSRLMLGEFAHSMPHERASVAVENATAAIEPHCPGHPGASTVHHGVSDADKLQDDSVTDSKSKDCCKGGDCECPCAHVTAMPHLSIFAVLPSVSGLQPGLIVVTPARERLSALFRPPA